MIEGHGGNIRKLARTLKCSSDDIIDMSSNLNPLGPPESIKDTFFNNFASIQSLPEVDAVTMRKGFARFHGVDHDQVIAGNGTTWFIYTIPKALGARQVLIAGPTYSDYKDACLMHGIEFKHCHSKASNMFDMDVDEISQLAKESDMVFICNPNNPTGSLLSRDKLEYLIGRHENTVFIIDESYLPFVKDARDISLVADARYKNLIVLTSMSKIFRIPGLRTGFLSAPKNLIEKIMVYYQPWSVNALAQVVIKDIFDHPEIIVPFYERTRKFIRTEKAIFLEQLKNTHKLQLFDSNTYFILARLTGRERAEEFCRKIGKNKILVRNCSNFAGLSDEYVRFSLKTRESNLNLARLIKQVL